jgi:di/tricarboxylate transporter
MAMPDDVGARMERVGERFAGGHHETRWALLTTEFWAMAFLIVFVLLAAAISDDLTAERAWTLVTVIGAAFILSRGLAKSGTTHIPPLPRPEE